MAIANTVSHAQVPLNHSAKQYYQSNPAAWLALQQQLQQRFEASTRQNEEYREQPRVVIPGTWTRIATPPVPLANPRLLTDGRVMAHNSSFTAPNTCGHRDWYVLTPDINGSYVNGTWTQVASLPSGYSPRFFGSGVLPDGRLIAVGGEYNGTCGPPPQDTNLGAIYDPVANSWTSVAPPTTAIIGDATGIVLPNGIYMQTDCCVTSSASPKTPLAWTLNPSTLAWTQTGASKFDLYDEEAIALLQNGLLLTVDAYVRVPPNFTTSSCGKGAELYNLRTVTGTITGTWSATGNVVDQQSDCFGVNASFEVGPLVVRPDGTAVSFSGVTQQAATTPVYADVYNPTAGTWSQLAQIPCVNTTTQLQAACGAGTVYYTLADAPAAVLPNGNILFAASPGHWPHSNSFLQPVHYFELECGFSDRDHHQHDNDQDDDRSDRPRGTCTSTPTVTQVPDRGNSAGLSSFQENLLVLPTGQVIAFSTDNSEVDIYTPKGLGYHPSWQPVVHKHPACVIPGDTYSLAGRQFNGLTEAGYYGDDVQAATNYPIVRIVNDRSGHVFYARTFSHSSRSIAPNAPVETSFQINALTETGDSTLYLVANGIPSAGRQIHVSHTCPVAVAKE
jgi:hypothetical protein